MKLILSPYSKELIKKAGNIKAIFFDADGVLSDGKIIYDENGKETKNFNVKDGFIITHLKKAGILTGIISGRDSGATAKRAVELKLDFCHQGILDKASVFEKLVKHYKLKMKEVAYIGDDINDLPVLRLAGLSVCPSDTFDYMKQEVDLVTRAGGGQGALREVADLVLAARGEMEKIIRG
ncbi:3-deoxy-D-manno-octulosonate 8-phosphate phosphatase (KDO 8-P phosphatase) [Chryseolinea serpens]|uniref:3-deoxy-D-manno-octulosonate 8-phosphate phosphatase (KDO 8-P phosphatase) n=1 Tax=Chryseolinea serpens TaxID=947013 RepID=A0A1M5KZ79_9BACT|nr:HAD-IIIA family hydrolase [Chryseolinea serpens]SHG58172.1 3-deoxy-D-manno-octulosonate 8-phosphate phosphatase (KDO 8-P phosphatase) [Chryseolinea serpens]